MSYTKSGRTTHRAKQWDESTLAACMAAISKWEKRLAEARCPRCGKRIGKVVDGVVIAKRMHCGPCRQRRLTPLG